MTDTTPRLALPYILPSQAQKHVTHNEALAVLDAVTQMVIEDSLATPPASPSEGNAYWILKDPTGAWAGHDDTLAVWQDGIWTFLRPKAGWLAFFRSSSRVLSYNGSRWDELALPENAQHKRLGVNATPDNTNLFAVASDAILFNHNGGDQRVKLNKATSGNTASLLYQSNWQGKAEVGLTGSDELSIKVCNSNGVWTTALTITGDGHVKQPAKPAATVRFGAVESVISGNLNTGFGKIMTSQGGMSFGAAVSGFGNSLKVPTAGTYLLSLTVSVSKTTNYAATVIDSAQTSLLTIAVGTITNPLQTSHTILASLEAGTELSMLHTGSATVGTLSPGAYLTAMLI